MDRVVCTSLFVLASVEIVAEKSGGEKGLEESSLVVDGGVELLRRGGLRWRDATSVTLTLEG